MPKTLKTCNNDRGMSIQYVQTKLKYQITPMHWINVLMFVVSFWTLSSLRTWVINSTKMLWFADTTKWPVNKNVYRACQRMYSNINFSNNKKYWRVLALQNETMTTALKKAKQL